MSLTAKEVIAFMVDATDYAWPSEIVREQYVELALWSASEVIPAVTQLAITLHARDVRALAREREQSAKAVRAGLWLAPDGSWRKGTRRDNVIIPWSEIAIL